MAEQTSSATTSHIKPNGKGNNKEMVSSEKTNRKRKVSCNDSPSKPKPKGGQDEPLKKRPRRAVSQTAHVKDGSDSSEGHSPVEETEGPHSKNQELVTNTPYNLRNKKPQK